MQVHGYMIRRTDKQKREDGLWDGSFGEAKVQFSLWG